MSAHVGNEGYLKILLEVAIAQAQIPEGIKLLIAEGIKFQICAAIKSVIPKGIPPQRT